MDRKAYKLPFQKVGLIRWKCPTCNTGRLKKKKDTFHAEETRESKKDRRDPEWYPDWIEYVYSCLFECTNPRCKEIIANSGTGGVGFDFDYDESGVQHQTYADFFDPKHFSPHLRIFLCPKATPDNVSSEIERSFSLFFSDAPSAANHVRIALEHLLTHLGIKRYEVKSNRRNFLALHRRIEQVPPKYKHLQELFFAIKWVGNAGSHSDKVVTKDDVLDAYEIMEEILQDLYLKKTKRAKKLAKEINKTKGPKKSAR